MELHYTREQLVDAYNKLPEIVREAISQLDMVETIERVSQKYNLHIDQQGQLSDTIGLVLFGLLSQNSFVDTIQRKLYLTSDQAREIAATVNLEIFARVQEGVRELSTQVLKPPPPPTPATPAPPSREAVLAELENPPPAPTTTVFEQKMAGLFNLPKAPNPPAPISTPTPAAPTKPWEEDPYLEKP